ncbi:hypothetical protein OSB04_030073 [Centaurea solstitialis]|uniref:non-specific serine/threonine protein kinase n=1 Tax=Centaurea solstitialis TaxID=347529 RepID=A0AA38SJI5_9ASTR|nr:hypothetical protein OSB04_030073 [Centaurea solstitialis]
MKRLKKPTSINPLFFTFFFFLKQYLCLHPDYEACVPKSCSENGPNISYPFFIQGLQNSSCGYPGLELNCTNGSPILRISNNDFRVENIDYERRYLRLQTTVILPNHTVACPWNIQNLTLDPNRFLIDNVTTTKLVFISNCSDNLNASLDRYRIRSCGRIGKMLVMLANDTNLRTVDETCGNVSRIGTLPVELGGGEVVIDGGNYAEVVERGFTMRWLAADCGPCRDSGGRCGFNNTSFEFRCFCRDRPHWLSCKPDEVHKDASNQFPSKTQFMGSHEIIKNQELRSASHR